MDAAGSAAAADQIWEHEILPTLQDYIRIPNRSPTFDADWQQAGHMERAVTLIADWCKKQPLAGLTVEVVRLPGRTPVIYMEVPARAEGGAPSQDTVLLYGHLDKQPEMTGWRAGLGPWTPVRQGDKLYGRGGADDGYAAFASLTALRILDQQGLPHARCVILIEACEESGSYDLPAYIDALAPRIGSPSLVVCLDSGCGNYDQLWMTTSLRGLISGNLSVEILQEGVHSGDASGIVPSSFRILRSILSRIEDENTGEVHLEALRIPVPTERHVQAVATADALGAEVYSKFPWVEGARPVVDHHAELILNRTWRPALSITGIDGIPGLASAGNVLRPKTTVKLSLRIPPRIDPRAATAALKAVLERDPPYGAKVRFDGEKASVGWDAPPLAPWLERAAHTASGAFFGRPAMAMGEGGSIPFMGMLGEKFPAAQFLITGLLGPESNAHGPNEFLHIPAGKRLTCCVAEVIAAHHHR
ncbi:MAG TPA: M20 family metallopeptidase [Pseudomonadota bacterium]|nr:M20 family metallopeptidase [Pseudomonadota bacterium]